MAAHTKGSPDSGKTLVLSCRTFLCRHLAITEKRMGESTQPQMSGIAVQSTMPKLVDGTLIDFDGQVALDQTERLENAIGKPLRNGRDEV